MLAERLRDRGYRTAAVVANPWLRGEFGFEQGFDTYVALDCGDLCDGKDVVREALGWLEKNSSSPFFLYLHFNDRLADAHRTKGFLQLFFEWDFQGALRSLERSVELDPSSALSHLWLSFCAWEGREDASLEALRKVQELDPLNLYIISVAAGSSTSGAARKNR
jgi:tetratricopeptide (TPR) repeat protein